MYRIFISYSHQDRSLAKAIEDILTANNLIPMFDRNFAFGSGFQDQIRRYIEHAHVFMPIITVNSRQRGWVHQEIGYAMALNIPVLPIAVDDAMPGEMIQLHHAVTIQAEKVKEKKISESDCVIRELIAHGEGDCGRKKKFRYRRIPTTSLQQIRSYLVPSTFERLIETSNEPSQASFTCAELHEDRTERIVEYAKCVSSIQSCVPRLTDSSRIRQKGGLSSFHIPDLPPTDDAWKHRYGVFDSEKVSKVASARRSSVKEPPRFAKTAHHCRLQREERIALTRHAEACGCRLIVSPNTQYDAYGDRARVVRLTHLLKFLESREVADVEIAFDSAEAADHSLTLVGDWFLAESVSGKAQMGYQQTIFSRHAPSMQRRIQRFDEEFIQLLGASGWSERDSRERAIAALKVILKKPNSKWSPS